MMPQPYPGTPICRHCDGFPVVHITTGQTTTAGRRTTTAATCPACHGTGHTAPARISVTAGR